MKALVIGSSGGIGKALTCHLQADERYDAVATLSRSADGLDITDEQSIADAARTLEKRYGCFELIINAAGALVVDGNLPEKTIKALTAEAMVGQFMVNAIGPALLLKHFCRLLPRTHRSVFASLSARVGSIGDNRLGGWISYRAAKTAQNQIVRTAALEIARTHPHAVVVALHPGTVATRLSEPFAKADAVVTPDLAAERLLGTIGAIQPSQSGSFISYDGQQIVW